MKCHKRSYRFETSAMVALASCRRSKKPRGERRYYKCPNCGNYHLTSQP